MLAEWKRLAAEWVDTDAVWVGPLLVEHETLRARKRVSKSLFGIRLRRQRRIASAR